MAKGEVKSSPAAAQTVVVDPMAKKKPASVGGMMGDKMQVGGFDKLATDRDKPTMEDICKRFELAKANRERYRQKTREVAKFFYPAQTDWNITSDHRGKNRWRGLYDSTGYEAVTTLTENGMERIMPVEGDWFSIEMSAAVRSAMGDTDDRLRLEGDLKRYGESVRHVLDRSNFRSAMKQAMMQFLVFGWSVVLPRLGKQGEGLMFEVFANQVVSLEYSPATKGGIFWEQKMTVREWNRMHPYAMADGADDAEKIIANASIPLGDLWLIVVWDTTKKESPLFARVSPESAAVVGKMEAAAGETYPDGVGAMLLPDMQRLNYTVQNHLQIMKMHTNPMFLIGNAVNAENFQVAPGRSFVVEAGINDNVANALAPVPVGGNAQLSMLEVEEMRQKVRAAINIMPTPLEPPPNHTATEWLLAKEKEQQSVIGKLDAFRREVVLPSIRLGIEILRGTSDNPLPETLPIDGKHFDIRVESTAERARKLNEVMEMRAMLEQFAVMPPEEVMAYVDFGALVRMCMEAFKMQDAVLPEEEADAFRASLAEAQMMQQQMAAQPAAAGVA